MTRSTSESRLYRPKVNSSDPWASSWSSPQERRVWDGSRVFEEQAEPVDDRYPFVSQGQDQGFAFDAIEAEVGVVGQAVHGMAVQVGVGNGGEHRADEPVAHGGEPRPLGRASSSAAMRAAAAIPTMAGMFSVPDRSPRSCPPPMVTGASRTPLRT